MAEKNYYWLKLMKDFFTKPKIKKLRRIAGGDTYTIIYLKMQLLSLDNEAIIRFENIEDTIEEEIALTIDEDVENVTVTLNYLLSQGLIKKISDNEYLLTETVKLIGSETSVAKRVRKYREKQKALQCNVDVTNCNIEIDIEKDKELELDLDKNSVDKDKKDEKDKKEKEETFKSILDEYTKNKELLESLNGFVEMRNKIKGFTIRALKLSLNKLDSLSNNDQEKIKIVDKTVMNGWKTFYELKDEEKPKESKLIQRNFEEEFGEIVDDIDF